MYSHEVTVIADALNKNANDQNEQIIHQVGDFQFCRVEMLKFDNFS